MACVENEDELLSGQLQSLFSVVSLKCLSLLQGSFSFLKLMWASGCPYVTHNLFFTGNRMSLQECQDKKVTEKGRKRVREWLRLTLSPQTGQSSSSPSFVSGCSDCPITPYSIDAPENRHGSDMMDDMYGLDVIDVMLLMLLLLLLLCCWTMVGLCMLAALLPPCPIPP